jgi:hypothetical protein
VTLKLRAVILDRRDEPEDDDYTRMALEKYWARGMMVE